MTDLKPPELFSQRPEHMQFVHEQYARVEIARMRSYRIRRFITCTVLAVALCGLVYEIVAWNTKPAEIPTIETEGSLKQKPEQPGGLDVPNQDVLAYQQLDNSGNQPAQDHMLPPPEVPQPSPPANANAKPLPTAPTVTLPPVPKIEDLNAPSVDALAPAPVMTQQSSSVTSPAQPVSPPPVPAKTAQAAPKAAAPPAPAKEDMNDDAVPAAPATPPAKSASGKKNYRVQLASFPDEDEATREMGRMQEKFSEQLGDAKLHLAKADLGARGIFYRVQSNPITSDEARDVCAALKKLKAGCIIVKP
jgi:hypothetical protein